MEPRDFHHYMSSFPFAVIVSSWEGELNTMSYAQNIVFPHPLFLEYSGL